MSSSLRLLVSPGDNPPLTKRTDDNAGGSTQDPPVLSVISCGFERPAVVRLCPASSAF